MRFLDYNPFPQPASLGEELVLYRKLRGLSQKQMAQVLGVDPTTLARWERGQRLPSAKQMGRIQELCQGCYGAVLPTDGLHPQGRWSRYVDVKAVPFLTAKDVK